MPTSYIINFSLSVSWLDAQTIKNRVIARSEATWQSQKPALYQEIATPVCALVRNDVRCKDLFVKQKFDKKEVANLHSSSKNRH